MTFSDFRFYSYFNYDEHPDDVVEKVFCAFDGSGSKLLGYPFFTQDDPRYDNTPYDTLLFQLDSTEEYVIWGDSGVGNFFINNEKLKNHDFSDVLFSWDCY